MGSGWGLEKSRTQPADVLIPNWSLGKPVALDLTVTSPLNAEIISEASVTAGSQHMQQRKHIANDPRCNELGWVCAPLAVELYGYWGSEAMQANSISTWITFSLSAALFQIPYILGSLSAKRYLEHIIKFVIKVPYIQITITSEL